MDNQNSSEGAASATPNNAARIVDAAHETAQRAKGMAAEKIEKTAQTASSSLGAVSDALRNAADELDQDHRWIASALRKTADGVRSTSEAVAGGDIERGLRGLGDFAHRQPAIFLGASFALGFALSRVGKTAIEQAGGQGDNSAMTEF